MQSLVWELFTETISHFYKNLGVMNWKKVAAEIKSWHASYCYLEISSLKYTLSTHTWLVLMTYFQYTMQTYSICHLPRDIDTILIADWLERIRPVLILGRNPIGI